MGPIRLQMVMMCCCSSLLSEMRVSKIVSFLLRSSLNFIFSSLIALYLSANLSKSERLLVAFVPISSYVLTLNDGDVPLVGPSLLDVVALSAIYELLLLPPLDALLLLLVLML